MIGLAILYWLCSHIPGLEVGKNAFYEELPLDPVTGAMERYGVYLTTEPAPVSRTSGLRQRLTVWVAIGEGAVDPTTKLPVAEKYETERVLSAVQSLINGSLGFYTELCELTIPGTNERFYDVRIDPEASKARGGTLFNGAIVKTTSCLCFYKAAETEQAHGR